MTDAVIELAGVSVRASGRRVLGDVDLAIGRGSIHVLIGPNGAGKSTLLSAILGHTAFAGTIQMHLIRDGRVGYVPQSFVADGTLPITIAELLALSRQRWPVCLGVTRGSRARVASILERVGLGGMEHRRIGELSGGELRRVMIGNAIDPPPEVLLCDEPATGLDLAAAAELDRTIRELRDRHATTVVMVSHDHASVRRVADQVTRLRVATGTESSIAQTGTCADVLGAPPP